MSVLEAFSTNTPVMLRDLDLYKSIINGYYLAAADEGVMNDQLHELLLNPDKLADLKKQTTIASERYSEDHLAKVWYDFYNQQSKEG